MSVTTATDPALRELHSGFLRNADAHPDRPALAVGEQEISYATLRDRAASLAATLQRELPDADPALTGVFAYRTVTAYAGILGSLLRGHGYVPLNRRFPAERTRVMLERSGARALIVDSQSATQLEDVLAGLEDEFVILMPDEDDVGDWRQRLSHHRVLARSQFESASNWDPSTVDPSSIVYLLFTSGSTGVPKGVMVAHRNVTHWVDTLVERYGITPEDRFSHMNEVTFDMSVFDMFVAWECGACVCCPSQKTLIKPDRYINAQRLTVWYSVPSTAIFLRRLGALRPDSLPTLRWSLFAGEPLPAEVAKTWQQAAPGSRVENLYGPTELTVVCMEYRWDPERSPAECEHGGVPMGWPLRGNRPLVVDSALQEVQPGELGELLVAGPQVALGYWREPEKTAAAFVSPPGREDVHYRTGDLVRRPLPGRPMTYHGRIDQQVQILGERVELGEVEAALRAEAQVDAVVAIGWPRTETGASGIEAFLGDPEVDVQTVLSALKTRLPAHMVPRRLHLLAELPLNSNGKFDRRALTELLEREGRR
jgi:amino acid adenylation domain-containing protein